MTEPASASVAEFSVLRALRQGLAVLKRDPGFYLGVSIIPVLLKLLLTLHVIRSQIFATASFGLLTWQSGSTLLFIGLISVVWAAMASAVFADLRGENVTRRNSLTQTARHLVAILLLSLPIFGVYLSTGPVITPLVVHFLDPMPFSFQSFWTLKVAALLIRSPGYIVLAIVGTAIPVCIVEKRGAIDSLMHSWNLSRGHRWAVLGVLLMIYTASFILETFMNGITSAQIIAPDVAPYAHALVVTLTIAFTAIIGATLYSELRAATEPAGAREIASVFE